jgi:hypothetical protein
MANATERRKRKNLLRRNIFRLMANENEGLGGGHEVRLPLLP